jgi:transcriptional regulator with XRE-family HTH domain
MNLSNKANEGGTSPLIVEGMAPMDVLLKRLGLTQSQFCAELGVAVATYQRWRASGVAASLNHIQAKKLDSMLRTIGLSIQDLPDDLTRREPNKSA